jgi:hypothetical protein
MNRYLLKQDGSYEIIEDSEESEITIVELCPSAYDNLNSLEWTDIYMRRTES